MFGAKDGHPQAASRKRGSVETLLGRQIEIEGNVCFVGGLHLEGRVLGNVTSGEDTEGHLSVGDTGIIEGDVRVASVVLNGTVLGDVYSTEKLSLGAKAKITGSVYYKAVELQAGAQINGKMVHESMAAAVVGRQQATAVTADPRMIESQSGVG